MQHGIHQEVVRQYPANVHVGYICTALVEEDQHLDQRIRSIDVAEDSFNQEIFLDF